MEKVLTDRLQRRKYVNAFGSVYGKLTSLVELSMIGNFNLLKGDPEKRLRDNV